MADPVPVVLGLDTSTVVQVGVARGSEVLATATVMDRMAHVEQLTPMIISVLEQAGLARTDLTQLVVGLGPGPFTGLRVGIVTAQVLAFSLRLPLHGVCSLDVIAAQYAAASSPDSEFVVATDARRREVYWARYATDGSRYGDPQVSRPDALPDQPVVGPGAELCPGRPQPADRPRSLDPATLATRGPQLPDAGREPLYLRRPDATESSRRKSTLLPPGAGRRMGPDRPSGLHLPGGRR